jgi:hypothetical protein
LSKVATWYPAATRAGTNAEVPGHGRLAAPGDQEQRLAVADDLKIERGAVAR